MPIAPKPFKRVCPKCGYSKVIKPKSDALGGDFFEAITCPKCKIPTERKEISPLNPFDMLSVVFKGRF